MTLSSDSLRKASQIIFDIDDIIKSELDSLESIYGSDNSDVPFQRAINKAKRKFEKRRGPLLIKPLNKKKSRIVLSDMEYDPITQVWKGNEKELTNFPANPALITNLFGKNEEKIIGNMKWDPNQKEWRGNEGDLSKFKFQKPALITQLNSNQYIKTENGMVYDPVSMKWTGNEQVLDVFESMDEQNKDNTFTVGKEFNLTPSLIASFKKSEEDHESDLAGWFPESRNLDDKDYLYSIRNMSIAKLIQLSIYSTIGGGVPSSTIGSSPASAVPSSPGGLISGIIPLISNKTKVIDETVQWDDVGFDEKPVLKLNLKNHDNQDSDNMSVNSGNTGDFDDASDWDKEMGFTSEDDNSMTDGVTSATSQPQTPRKIEEWSSSDFEANNTSTGNLGKIIQLNKFKEKSPDEEDDDDDDVDWSGFNTTTKPNVSGGNIGTITNLNKGTIKQMGNGTGSIKQRSNVNNIPSLNSIFNNPNNNNGTGNISLSSSGNNIFSKNTPPPSQHDSSMDETDNESFFEGVELPKGSKPLSLHKDIHNDEFNKLIMSGEEPHEETRRFFENDKDVIEEDWPEVQWPNSFGIKSNESRKSSPPLKQQQVEDYSDELEISKPLQLKKPTILADNPFGDSDEDWTNDISFPVNFRPSTPSQPMRASNGANSLTPPAAYTTTNSTLKPNTIGVINNMNQIKPTTTTTTTTTKSTTNNSKPLTMPNLSNFVENDDDDDDFQPLSPNSRNIALTTPESSPRTPFKYIQRSNTGV